MSESCLRSREKVSYKQRGTHRYLILDLVARYSIHICLFSKFVGEGEYVIPTSTIFGLTPDEMSALKKDGLQISDNNPKVEGVEVSGASPFKVPTRERSKVFQLFPILSLKVMRLMCGKHGWSTNGEPVSTTVSDGKTSWMWTLSRKIK